MVIQQELVSSDLSVQRSDLLITERAYDLAMTDLLSKCKLAKDSGNKEIKDSVLEIVKGWRRFFQAEKKLIKRMKKDEQKGNILSFIDDQIKFLGVLVKELKEVKK